MNKILICFGTRPEVIKLAPLIPVLSEYFNVITVFTGQHTSLYNDVSSLIPKVDYSIDLENKNNIDIYSKIPPKILDIFNKENPDLVIVQGDTSSAYSIALTAFLSKIKIGHVEAGLRTYNIMSPFPEEFNRQMISKIATYNWCPSKESYDNLLKENVCGKLFITGNTIVDIVRKYCSNNIIKNNRIIITLHRRENELAFLKILNEIDVVANNNKDLDFIFPVHPNPIIRSKVEVLKSKNINICNSMGYIEFLGQLESCRGIITDSGGIQEESICLKKKILICRDTTERPECVKLGIGRLIGSDICKNFDWLLKDEIIEYENPLGDGYSSEKILNTIKI
jgi:UDP-N-acetylglucosamine 2-epimerase (non-hydrolysing)